MDRAPESTTAFNELIALLGEMRDAYVLSPERFTDELDIVEGFRYVTQLLSEASELLIEADPERPRFSSIVSPARKFLGDNPDALYQQAVIRGDRAYRISGRKDRQTYMSFTVHGTDPSGSINGPVLADINDRDLDFAADGSFELILSPDERPRAWIKLHPDARLILVRNYYLQRQSAQNDPDLAVRLHIEPLVDPGAPPPLDDQTFARRLRDANAFLRGTSVGMRHWGERSTAPFVSNEINTVGKPWSFRSSNIAAAGAVDIFYSSGSFDLAPEEALVMEGTLPSCVFANVMIWNVHMQTLEYRYRRSSLNAAQMELGADDTYRIVIAAQDPGVANWLDTGGHRRGTIFWRFLLPDQDPATPRCTVLPITAVAPTRMDSRG
ncbi:MAG TPA: DUF1214 domain-containing protein [Acidimicrobiales bacterium]|jgi:hypothetical protein|nr:DUF1214 domain-containing protein [Acidimicrobiales bacterium]